MGSHGTIKKAGAEQASIRSFFGGGASTKTSSEQIVKSTEEKENNVSEKKANLLASVSDDDDSVSMRRETKRLKRNVVNEDEDDEEDDIDMIKNEATEAPSNLSRSKESSPKVNGFKSLEEARCHKTLNAANEDKKKETEEISKETHAVSISAGSWLAGKPVPYSVLSEVFSKIEQVAGRLVIQQLLTETFQNIIHLTPNNLLPCVYLCICTNLAPPYKGVQIGIGDSILMKAIGEATGCKLSHLKSQYEKEGDLGLVAEKNRGSQRTLGFTKPKPLYAKDVYDKFLQIADTKGGKSQDKKVAIIKSLLVSCQNDDAKYVIRGLQGKLRIGLAEKTILIALAHAALPEKASDEERERAVALVKKAFSECPSYDDLVPALLECKTMEDILKRCKLVPGRPVAPMLARPTKSYSVVFDRFVNKPFTCEYKYDGERAQIHIRDGGKDISIFSRNFENSTERFPDVVQSMIECMDPATLTNAIIDAEVVAIDPITNKRLPFQVLSTRARKNVSIADIKVKVCIYGFDLLYINDKSMLGEPLQIRRQALQDNFRVIDGKFELATSLDVSNTEDEDLETKVEMIQKFLEKAIVDNCEGLMVKTLEQGATYEPANRSHKWLKLKKDYLEGIGDSVDLVPIGAFYGKGKRTGVYGAYLLACYDPDDEMYQCITKLGTGLSDEVLKKFYEELKICTRDGPRSDYSVCDGSQPDVWFEAKQVWEILGADLSISPKYTSAMGLVANGKGISLRFPRFIRVREDKRTIDATTAEQIADLYRAQGLANGNDDMDDDEDAL